MPPLRQPSEPQSQSQPQPDPAPNSAAAQQQAMATTYPCQRSASASTPTPLSHQAIRSFLAGGIAGSVAKTSVAPLDRVKILFQASSPEFKKYAGTYGGTFKACQVIWRDSGIRGLFQGHSATLLRIFPYAGIKFAAYEEAKATFMPTKASETPLRHFVVGAIAGVTSVFVTYPLELIRVRLAVDTHAAADHHSGRGAVSDRSVLFQTVKKIYTEGEGFRDSTTMSASSSASTAIVSTSSTGSSPSTPSAGASTSAAVPRQASLRLMPIAALSHSAFSTFPILKFYRGFTVSVVGMIPYAGTSFLVFNTLRSWRPPPSSKGKSSAHTALDLLYGALAGMTSQTASYPFEVVRRRMQIGGLLSPNRLVGFWETVGTIVRERGWKGFFVGLSIGYVKVVPMTGVSFATYMAVKDVLGVQDRK